MANETIKTTDVKLAEDTVRELFRKVSDTSSIAHLSNAAPVTFGKTNIPVFSVEPEAEFVAEGASKSPSSAQFSNVVAEPHKAQVTVRMNDELKWADEDGRVAIIDGLLDSLTNATARALDYGIYHAVSPRTGDVVSGMTALTAGASKVEESDKSVEEIIDQMVVKVVEAGYTPNGLALSPAKAMDIFADRDTDGRKLYPDFKIGSNVNNVFEGFDAFTSSTVNGARCKVDPNIHAILGDYNLIRWGISRDLGIEVIEFGDPDGLGDLKRNNQIAYRAEIVYSWAVIDPLGFAYLTDKTTAKS